MSAPASLRAFVKLGRPQFLIGGFVLYALGAALAALGGAAIGWRRYVVGQLAVTATQLMTHYSNDYFDLEADRANTTPTRWSGGSRVLVGGAVPAAAALYAALVLAALAAAAGAALAGRGHAPRFAYPLLLLMIALSWCYSAPPARLLARGLGELTTALVVTLLVPLFAFYLQAGAVGRALLLAALPLCALQLAMLLAIEFPDAAGDAAGGKRTLVVRRGPDAAARLYAIAVAGAYLWLPLAAWLGLPARVAAAAALVAPVGAWNAARMLRGAHRDPARWESLAFWSVAQLIATATAELAGVLSLVN